MFHSAQPTLPAADETLPLRQGTFPARKETLPLPNATFPLSNETLPGGDETSGYGEAILPRRGASAPDKVRWGMLRILHPLSLRAILRNDRKAYDRLIAFRLFLLNLFRKLS